MNRAVRTTFFLFFALFVFGLLLWGLRGVPPLGHYAGPYGDVANAITVYERHVTDVVTAVNFDIRGFDTLGEEFILFISVAGCVLLLRRQKDESKQGGGGNREDDRSADRQAPSPSDAVKVITMGLVGPLVVFGLYIVSHGQLTPGGGFQGGVILATAPLLVYLAGDFETFKSITSHKLVEVTEATGALGYLALGFLGYAAGRAFLQNVLPLGETGNITSGGTITLISISVGLEVAAGFVLLLHAFLEQTLEIRAKGEQK